MDQAVNEYARITRKLKDARKSVLETEGMTEDSLQTLHDQALSLMDVETVETEWGLVQKIPDVEVSWGAYRLKDGMMMAPKSFKKRLKLLTNAKSHTQGGVKS